MARKVLGSLRSLLRDAQRRGNVAQNVALGVKRIDADKRSEGRLEVGVDIPAPEEVRAILAAAKRHRPLLMTAAFTGLRASELRGLRWSDVDLKGGKLNVRQRADRYNKIGEPKSKAGHRAVPLGPMVANTLREWRLVFPPRGEAGLVFPTASGHIVAHSQLVRWLQAAVRAAGLTDQNGQPNTRGRMR